MDVGLITPSTQVYDGVVKLKGTNWFPQNAGGGYSGNITILTALVRSLEHRLRQILDKLGIATSWSYLTERLGFTSPGGTATRPTPPVPGPADLRRHGPGDGPGLHGPCHGRPFSYARSYTHVLDSDGNVVLDNQPDQIAASSPTPLTP